MRETILMGVNTDPAWTKADEVIERWRAEGDEDMVRKWEMMKSESIKLRNLIKSTIEEKGECSLSWSCTGRTRHSMHAANWSRALPEYDFEIGDNYECVVRRRS